ncbi:hypothetical protein EYC84_004291 [Monilinia fructicola]|uniref:Uncharacterized protein n=1 Tax=Monilinia fructicola TaxID=38448 RepID=A0A5M9K2Q5_MONFR|nr:hypothetical protein EYC84_004291 [Monilinia fructicola]
MLIKNEGGELRSRALPTFTNILHTLAPPISSHERLQIHITHDFIGYLSLDPLIYSTFSRVMAQVEGGDLLVIQRGHESTARRASEAGYTGGAAGWSDGPWWRVGTDNRDIGSVKGLIEGTKLVRVSAEAYSKEYFDAHGGLELAAQRATEDLSESKTLFAAAISSWLFKQFPMKHQRICSKELFPAKWIQWLDAPAPLTPASAVSPSKEKSGFFGTESADVYSGLPEEIQQIIESGGVDPREWVAEWVEETLSLGVGGIGKGKARMEEVLGDGGGEAARAGLI